ncbi:NAD(P)H-dependent glycerol-3-phosphate dehydrogenase [Engelhardtia mirabilis]|uniref:Glycerol-3-phosphate dehydrogenase [NAD(P)+] n=1 Tax=Engelhardtia mirabilis TaxID=2528011 RepID=A0A518BH74_9BACT|nr:Glycerol-3-phosphate dehydrogenase [NAD(P)+] [Planctomycetes bacterium Pla133]QDV00642.1 Glycerol-3-phosphate dehydrogenase [NAD(P)+] [Planctomycetes bacterium Pla86]
MAEKTRILVLGDGSWGTALARLLVQNGADVVLWSAFPERLREMSERRANEAYLPGISLPQALRFEADPFAAARGVDLCLSVVPTQHLRKVVTRFEDALGGNVPIVSATKGLEIETFQRPTEIIASELGDRPLCVLAGPSHAEEVARGLPASLVAACDDTAVAEQVQAAFNSETFRVYRSTDPIGVELAGALKNVIAIAAGISDGLGLGDNAKAALLTRGLVEMARFGVSRGARLETFFGLAGMGDLITTCTSRHSRNRAVGEHIGRGKTLQDVLAEMSMVAEGVWTTQALFGPEAEGVAVSMPIAEQVHAVLFEGVDPEEAVRTLMQRSPTAEMEGLLPGSSGA